MKEEITEKIIPILPCADIKITSAFYKELGFEVLGLYTSPHPYATLRWKNIDLHFWGSRKADPAKNSSMCYMFVKDVDEVNRTFTSALKKLYGRIPRSGFPKITKVRNLVDDRRFTLTDPGGNTFYIGSPATKDDRFFRTLENQKHAKIFSVLYDVMYSKEEPEMAASMLPKYWGIGEELMGLDQAKFMLLIEDIRITTGSKKKDNRLDLLIRELGDSSDDWRRIKRRYEEINSSDE